MWDMIPACNMQHRIFVIRQRIELIKSSLFFTAQYLRI